jgi:transcriptional regulator with XRE-family HTH domain
MHIGAKIRQLREQQGFTQADIETRTGLKHCHISRIENGHNLPSLKTAQRIVDALNLPL